MRPILKPLEGEYAPYTIMYIGLLPDDRQVLQHMQANMTKMQTLVSSFSDDALHTACAADEWTIKEILVHIIDDERIYAYRALRAARNDQTELPGFDPDDFARYSAANERSLSSILAEYATVRSATLTLFDNLPSEALTRAAISNGNRMSVRAAAYHLAGHELHHLNSIKENYGNGELDRVNSDA